MKTSKVVLFWLPMVIIGIVNGLFREVVLKAIIGDPVIAGQISTGLLMLLLTLYIISIYKSLKIPSLKEAFATGGTWVLLTFVFESSLGYFVSHLTIQQIAAEYNILQGKLWPLVLLLLFTLPAIVFQITRQRSYTIKDRTV